MRMLPKFHVHDHGFFDEKGRAPASYRRRYRAQAIAIGMQEHLAKKGRSRIDKVLAEVRAEIAAKPKRRKKRESYPFGPEDE